MTPIEIKKAIRVISTQKKPLESAYMKKKVTA